MSHSWTAFWTTLYRTLRACWMPVWARCSRSMQSNENLRDGGTWGDLVDVPQLASSDCARQTRIIDEVTVEFTPDGQAYVPDISNVWFENEGQIHLFNGDTNTTTSTKTSHVDLTLCEGVTNLAGVTSIDGTYLLSMDIPAYRLCLLRDFVKECRICKVTFFEQTGAVQFEGPEEQCRNAHYEFMIRINNLQEDGLSISSNVASELRSPNGMVQLSNLCRTHGCSVLMETDYLRCAAHDMRQVTAFLQDFQQKFYQEKNEFQISSPLVDKVCKQWYRTQLDEIKQAVMKNGGVVHEEFTPSVYKLSYTCSRSVHDALQDKMAAIKQDLVVFYIDLTSHFRSQSDVALVVNGLHNNKVESFCLGVENTLKQQGVDCFLSLDLPLKCSLLKFRWDGITTSKQLGHDVSVPESIGHSREKGAHNPFQDGRDTSIPLSVTICGTTVTIKAGDITTEKIKVLVNVLGEDLNMKNTAIGAAILKKCPQAEVLLEEARQNFKQDFKSKVISTHIPSKVRSHLPASFVLHAVIGKWSHDQIKANVRTLVQNCLQEAVKLKQTSIALPPLGVGRRFQFNLDEVADAMIHSVVDFLLQKPSCLKTIIFVVSDTKVNATFRKVLTFAVGQEEVTKHNGKENAAFDGNGGSAGCSDLETFNGKFQASVCVRGSSYKDRVTDLMLTEMRETFLCQETVADINTAQKLSAEDLEAIQNEADKHDVILTISDNGDCGELKVRGQLGALRTVKTLIDHKLKDRLRRDAHLFPKYWSLREIHKVDDFEMYEARGERFPKLLAVSVGEKAAIQQLICDTWDVTLVGQGNDARNLRHKNISVQNIERLENPDLWEKYCEKRKGLLRRLKKIPGESQASFTPVENLPKSKGPVKTTYNLSPGNVLHRDFYHQVNEHYLFHGFQAQRKDSIVKEGLDSRLGDSEAMLGKGIYAAESSTKADQYADTPDARTNNNKTMILMRVLIGQPFLNYDVTPQKWQRPPCKKCKNSTCSAGCNSHKFDSIIDNANRLFREFVVYEPSLCYPEYFITYSRL